MSTTADDPGSAVDAGASSSRSVGKVAGDVAQVGIYPLILLILNQGIDQADRFLLAAVFPQIKEEFGLSDTALGTLSAAFVVVGALATVPFGILADRVKRVKLIAWGTAIWSTAMIMTGLASSYAGLLFSRMFLGIMEASNGPAAFSLISDWYPVARRGRMLGYYQIGAILGFVSLPIGGFIADTWGWRTAFFVYAIPGFIFTLFALRLPEPLRGKQDREYRDIAEVEGDPRAFAKLGSLQAFKLVLRIPTVWITFVANSLSGFFLAGLGIWAISFMERYHGMSTTQASASAGFLAIGAIAGALLGGQLGDRLVKRGLFAGRIYVAGSAQVAGAILLFPAFATDSTALMLVLFAFGAVTLTMPGPPLGAVRADVIHPDLRGRAASVMSLLSVGAGALSPLTFGAISDAATLRTAILVLLPLMAVGGLILLTFGSRHLRPDTEHMRRQLAGEEPPPFASPSPAG